MKTILLLGDRNAQALTHRELDTAIALLPSGVQGRWVSTDTPDAKHTEGADGVWVVPGSPYRNDEVVYAAINSARTSGQPFLGTCAGFQYAVVEFARNAAGVMDAGHGETSPDGNHLVVERLSCSLVGQTRTVTAVPGTRMHNLCGEIPFMGFHWCNFGVAPAYVDQLTAHGLVIAARADDAGVEAVELPDHPFYLATLFQPQVGSAATRVLHPVIQAFVAAL